MTQCSLLASALLLSVFVVGLSRAATASATTNPGTIEIQSDCPPAVCTVFSGGDFPPNPQPATGSADFQPAGMPWTFSFTTGNPLTWDWSDGNENYYATYGVGGSFSMTGPDGTFAGVVTSGFSLEYSNTEVEAYVTYTGAWSDGKHASGSAEVLYEDDLSSIETATLVMTTTPEPGSLVLFGSGVVGIAGLIRRKTRT